MQNLFAEAHWLMESSLGDATLNIDGTQAHTDIGGAVGSIVEPFDFLQRHLLQVRGRQYETQLQ